jgi:hypothetical protein
MKYIVNTSGGLTSFEAARRTIAQHGKENTVAIFADTRMEDEDLYRFLDDQERYFGITIHRIADGRTPWQVMKDERMITMQSMAPCSRILKHDLIDNWIAQQFSPDECTRVFGMDWTELHRVERLAHTLAPSPIWFPLCEPPFVDKCWIAQDLERIGMKVPRLYELGFSHNNCSAMCVKAGQAHWAHLWRTLPERYLDAEQKEQEIREYLGKDISILKDRRGGRTRPLTLRAFRRRLESGKPYDKNAWGGCGCFVSGSVQSRMDDLMLATPVRLDRKKVPA